MYVDASDNCNEFNFQLGPTGIGATIPARNWNMKVRRRHINKRFFLVLLWYTILDFLDFIKFILISINTEHYFKIRDANTFLTLELKL